MQNAKEYALELKRIAQDKDNLFKHRLEALQMLLECGWGRISVYGPSLLERPRA